MLLTWHNVTYYYQHLMAGMRDAIAASSFAAFTQAFAENYYRGDAESPVACASADE
jgi:queuine tRNA-ribosyltransferase